MYISVPQIYQSQYKIQLKSQENINTMLWWSFLQLFLSLCHQQLKKKSGSDVGRFQDSCSKKLLSWWNCLLLIPPPISLFSGSLSQILTCWGSGFLTTFWDDLQKDNSTENSVEIARKTADFGIESNKNLFRHQLRLGFAKQASCMGCPNQKDSAR